MTDRLHSCRESADGRHQAMLTPESADICVHCCQPMQRPLLRRRTLYARIVVDMAAIARQREADRALTTRMAAARLSPKHARKAWRRIRSYRVYVRIFKPELDGLIADLARPIPDVDYTGFEWLGISRAGWNTPADDPDDHLGGVGGE